MTAFNFILAFISAGLMFYAMYFLTEAILIHKKFFDKRVYFVIASIGGSLFAFFELLLSLSYSDSEYLLFHKLKWVGAIISIPFQMLTFFDCFFPKGRKFVPIFMVSVIPIFLFSLIGNSFLSLPIKTIIIPTKFSDFIYHLATPNFMYLIYGIILFLSLIILVIYSYLSKKTFRKLPLVIYFLAAILSTANDMFVYRNMYSNIFLIEYLFPASFTFIFFDFILENKKAHLSVLELKNEAVRRLRITEIYTRKSLVSEIEKGNDPTRFQPNNIQIATLFSDIRDFTGISEGLKPLEVVELLNVYFNRMNATIIKHNGEIDKLMGDCIMALFRNPDDALRSAIEMRCELERFNTSPQPSSNDRESEFPPLRGGSGWGKTINNGIGLNFGEVIIGNIGSESKMDYTVVGDIVNTASRLEALTKYYKVPLIISEDLKIQLKNEYKIRFLDEALIKGKTTPVKIYEVFDFEPAEIIEMKQRNVGLLAEAFGYYQAGEFLQAIQIYKLIGQASLLVSDENKTAVQASLLVNNEDKIIEHGQSGMIDLPSSDPVLSFFISRCHKLHAQKEAGLLKDWSGVFEFMDK